MRTPGNDLELCRGFLVTEGIARHLDNRVELRHVAPNVVDATVPDDLVLSRPSARQLYATSSCGVCGKASIAAVDLRFARIESEAQIQRELLYAMPQLLSADQTVFARTGGLHGAALFEAESGRLLAVREDIGRHNAVDKLVGWGTLEGSLPWSRQALLVSGRVSFEIVQKAQAAGAPIVVGVSAPSSLAVRLAEERGMTLVGFLRGRSFNVYAHPERIRG
jgi:FdhD protein